MLCIAKCQARNLPHMRWKQKRKVSWYARSPRIRRVSGTRLHSQPDLGMVDPRAFEVLRQLLVQTHKRSIKIGSSERLRHVRPQVSRADADRYADRPSEDRRRVPDQLPIAKLERRTLQQSQAKKIRPLDQALQSRHRPSGEATHPGVLSSPGNSVVRVHKRRDIFSHENWNLIPVQYGRVVDRQHWIEIGLVLPVPLVTSLAVINADNDYWFH